MFLFVKCALMRGRGEERLRLIKYSSQSARQKLLWYKPAGFVRYPVILVKLLFHSATCRAASNTSTQSMNTGVSVEYMFIWNRMRHLRVEIVTNRFCRECRAKLIYGATGGGSGVVCSYRTYCIPQRWKVEIKIFSFFLKFLFDFTTPSSNISKVD